MGFVLEISACLEGELCGSEFGEKGAGVVEFGSDFSLVELSGGIEFCEELYLFESGGSEGGFLVGPCRGAGERGVFFGDEFPVEVRERFLNVRIELASGFGGEGAAEGIGNFEVGAEIEGGVIASELASGGELGNGAFLILEGLGIERKRDFSRGIPWKLGVEVEGGNAPCDIEIFGEEVLDAFKIEGFVTELDGVVGLKVT